MDGSAQIVSKISTRQRDDGASAAKEAVSGERRSSRKAAGKRAPREGKSSRGTDGHSTPRWRQIEALREREELRRALADIWMEDPDLDEGIFGLDGDSRRYYMRAESDDVEDVEVDDLEEDLDEIDPELDED